jgi:hypothetical protein
MSPGSTTVAAAEAAEDIRRSAEQIAIAQLGRGGGHVTGSDIDRSIAQLQQMNAALHHARWQSKEAPATAPTSPPQQRSQYGTHFPEGGSPQPAAGTLAAPPAEGPKTVGSAAAEWQETAATKDTAGESVIFGRATRVVRCTKRRGSQARQAGGAAATPRVAGGRAAHGRRTRLATGESGIFSRATQTA